MTKKRLDTEVRREQILEVVMDLLSNKGMKGLSLSAVARRVGFVPSALYRHFSSKDEVVDALLSHIEASLLNNVVAVRAETAHPLEAIELLLRRHVRLIRENRGIPRVIFSEEVYGGDPRRRARVYRMLQQYLGGVGSLFLEAQQAGMVRSDLAPNELAVMFLGLIQPAAILWHLSDGGFDVTRQAERAWRVFSETIRNNCVTASETERAIRATEEAKA